MLYLGIDDFTYQLGFQGLSMSLLFFFLHFLTCSLTGMSKITEGRTRHLFTCYPLLKDRLLIPSSTLPMEENLYLLMLHKFLANDLVVEFYFI